MKLAALYFPAVFLDAPQPGEYVRDRGAVTIACVRCGVVQPVGNLDLIHACANAACAMVAWVELASDRE